MIGIDLGTSNSAIAVFDDGEAVVTKVMPSVVAYLDEEVVGHAARNLQLLFPDAVVASSKRHMGTTHVYDTPMGPRTPEEVAAAILRRLTKPCAAVITVPAYFGDAERRATLKAAALAGIEVLRLLNEPTAAALQYDQRRERETILVYDLGGGTFDASLVEVTGELRHVKATRGIARLGGDDIDALLGRKLGVPARAAEKAKIALSTLRECRVSEVVGGKHVRAHVSRDELEALMTPLIERTTDLCAELLRDAGMRSERVDRVCLVGGPTRAPLIRGMIERALGIPAHVDLEPELAVVKGAAIQAAILAGEQPRRALIDVASHSLGIAAAEPDQDVTVDKPNSFVAIIKRNTPLPCKRVEIFETAQDNQSSVVVDIYQGEAEKASDNRHLGELELPLVPSPAGTEVAVAFSYDLDGVVQVELVHAGETQTRRLLTQAATPRADTAIARRVAELLPQLGPDARAKLQAAYDAWCLDPAAHDDQLLDLFLSH